MDAFYVQNFDKEQNFVQVETLSGPLKGYLHVIDPESGTLIVQCTDSVVVLSQAAVVSLTLSEACIEELSAFPVTTFESQRKSKESLSCQHLIEEFRKRLIDAKVVVKDGEKHISLFDGAAWMIPPYDRSSCFSENETVLARLHQLLSDITNQEQVG